MVHNVKVDLKSDLFAYEIDARALKYAKMMDGKLFLVTNAPDFTPEEVVKRDGSLADFERGFRITVTVNTFRMFRLPSMAKRSKPHCVFSNQVDYSSSNIPGSQPLLADKPVFQRVAAQQLRL